MGSPEVPNPWAIGMTLAGGVDMDLDEIRIKEIPTITLESTSTLTSTSTLNSTSTVDMGLDDIRIKELPTIDFHLQTSMKPTRVHFPMNMKFALCTLGTEVVSFSICGESMVVVEDYVMHRTEECL
jgi:hypothetical protein